MSIGTNGLERIAALEQRVSQVERELAQITLDAKEAARIAAADRSKIEAKIDRVAETVQELRDVLLQARGARWAVMIVIGIASAVTSALAWMSGFASKIGSAFGGVPR